MTGTMKKPTGFTVSHQRSQNLMMSLPGMWPRFPFGPQVVQDYPEVQSFVRFINMPASLYKYEDKEFNEENFYYADSTLFDIFTYKVIKGEVKQPYGTEKNSSY